jgi:hypothetical protein
MIRDHRTDIRDTEHVPDCCHLPGGSLEYVITASPYADHVWCAAARGHVDVPGQWAATRCLVYRRKRSPTVEGKEAEKSSRKKGFQETIIIKVNNFSST